MFLSTDVKFTHPSNEVPQDNIIMFQDPLVLMGLIMNKKRHIKVLFQTVRPAREERKAKEDNLKERSLENTFRFAYVVICNSYGSTLITLC